MTGLERFLMALLLSFIFFSEPMLSREEIAFTVWENHDMILEDMAQQDFADTLALEGIEEITSWPGGHVFHCGGAGLIPESLSTGFFSVSPDEGLDAWLADAKPYEGGWLWEGDGDNYYFAEKLCDHFYYYQEHY